MARKTKPTKIHLVGDGRTEELVAAAIITPGMLVGMDADGAGVPHASAGDPAEKLFATEDALQGRGIGTNYAVGDRVGLVVAETGDVVYGWLADGESVTPADFLTSNGDGSLKKATSGDYLIGVPLEAMDLSASSNAAADRIRVRCL